MKPAAAFVAVLLAGTASAGEFDFQRSARTWYEARLKEEKPDLAIDSVEPIQLPAVADHVRFFEGRARSQAENRCGWDSRVIAVKSDGTAWAWKGGLEDVRALLSECGLRGADAAGMRAAAAVVMALPGERGFEEKRCSVSGRTVTYRDHRATGGFSCGFMGWYREDVVITFDEAGVVASIAGEKKDMELEQYRALRKAGDPLFVDEIGGGDDMIRFMDDLDAKRTELATALRNGDEAAVRAAQRFGVPDAELDKAAPGASDAAKERIGRVKRWLAPEWAAGSDEEARRWYEKQLPAADDKWVVKAFERVELEGGAEPLKWTFRLFRAQCVSKSGVQGKHDLVLVAKDGGCRIWTGEMADLREVLERAGLVSDGGEGTRRAVAAAQALPIDAYQAKQVRPVEAERIEVRGRDGIFHVHRLWLGSGVLGRYTEDVIFEFGDDGLLKGQRETGIQNLKMADLDRLLADADPWLTLEGWVSKGTAERLKRAQEKKEKTPPRHGDGK